MLNITPIIQSGVNIKRILRYAFIILLLALSLVFGIFIGLHYRTSPTPTPNTEMIDVLPQADEDATDPIIQFILEREGGYNPNDPSFEGVYQPTYEWFKEANGITDAPAHVRDLQDRMDLVHEFYRWYLYTLRSGISEVPDWFQLPLADWWTTSGGYAIRPLQEWSGVEIDGVWGSHTEAAVMEAFTNIDDPSMFIRWYTQKRKDFYRENGYNSSHSLFARTDMAKSKALAKLHGSNIVTDRVVKMDMRIHAPVKALSADQRINQLEEQLGRFEQLLMKALDTKD